MKVFLSNLVGKLHHKHGNQQDVPSRPLERVISYAWMGHRPASPTHLLLRHPALPQWRLSGEWSCEAGGLLRWVGNFMLVILTRCCIVFTYLFSVSIRHSPGQILHPHCWSRIWRPWVQHEHSAQGAFQNGKPSSPPHLQTSRRGTSKRGCSGVRWRRRSWTMFGQVALFSGREDFLKQKKIAATCFLKNKSNNTYQYSNQGLVSNNSALLGAENGI